MGRTSPVCPIWPIYILFPPWDSFDTAFPNSLHCPLRFCAGRNRRMALAGPARRAEDERTAGSRVPCAEAARSAQVKFSEPHHSLSNLGDSTRRNRLAASRQDDLLSTGPPSTTHAGSLAAVPRSGLRHIRISGNLFFRRRRWPGAAFLFRALPRSLPDRAIVPGMTDHRRNTADGQRQ